MNNLSAIGDAATNLGELLARVENVDEAVVCRELRWRFKRDTAAIRRGLEAWRAAHAARHPAALRSCGACGRTVDDDLLLCAQCLKRRGRTDRRDLQ